MATGDRLFSTRYVEKNSTAMDGARYAEIEPMGLPEVTDPGDADAPGPVEVQAGVPGDIRVRVFGTNPIDLLAYIGSAAENIVVGIKAEEGANEKVTVKNVVFTQPVGPIRIKAPDEGGIVTVYGVQGRCEWGDADSYALMIVKAADA